jgi:hypothetical protein
MAERATKKKTKKQVERITHDGAKRKNVPTAEYQSVMKKEDQDPLRVAYERRNRDLDTQLVWRGKDEQDWSAWATLHSDTSRPFDKPENGRIAVKVINHLGDEVMKVFRV